MGLEGELGGVVEKSFKRFVKLLDDHLRKHLFIFGGRPSIADFAIAGQLIQMMKDPTPAKIIEKDGEFVAKWCEFLEDPKPSGPFEALDDLKETLGPIFAGELACAFLPWAAENLENSLAGNESFEVTIGKETFPLAPLRSAARSFRELRRKFVTGQTIEPLKAFTDETGTTIFLLRPPRPDQRPDQRPERRPGQQAERHEGPPSEDQAPAGDGEAISSEEEVSDAPPQDAREEGEGGARRKRRRRRRSRGRGEVAQSETHSEASAESSEAGGDADASGDDAGDADADGGDAED
jgi:hypothetical protein